MNGMGKRGGEGRGIVFDDWQGKRGRGIMGIGRKGRERRKVMEKGQGKGTDTLPTDNVFTRKEYIEREAFITRQRELYCQNCDRRRGMKDGKLTKRFVYPIGGAPCRACDVDDMINAVEDYPAADVMPVVRCRDCKHRDPEDKKCDCGGLEHAHMFPVADDWFCADGERKDGDGDA